jgi:CheY-like chemotaxis protein/curved DNA-binding protein CbpA
MSHTKPEKRILVVEDNEDVRKVVSIYLKANEYHILEADNGQTGLDIAIKENPDLILLDVLLPRLDGIEVLKRLRKKEVGADIPVVMMSAVLQTRDLMAETSNLQVKSFLQKPFHVKSLLKTVEEALKEKNSIEPGSGLPADSTRSLTQTRFKMHTFPSASPAPLPTKRGEVVKIVCKQEHLPARGSLTSFPVPKIINAIFVDGLTGRLRIVEGSAEKRIYFQNGFPVYAESSSPGETLGAFLVKEKSITEEQHGKVQKIMYTEGRQYGEILLRLNIIGPNELFRALEMHLAQKLVSTFLWRRGKFLFESGDSWINDVIVTRMKPGRIILDGIYKCWTLEEIGKTGVIHEFNRPFILKDSPYQREQLLFTTQEERIYQLVKQEHKVKTIISSIKDTELAFKTLFSFYIIGIIGLKVEKMRMGMMSMPVSLPAWQDEKPNEQKLTEQAQILLSEYLKYRTADYFKLLGVQRDASNDEIKRAFEIRRRRYHPDMIVGVDKGLVHEKIEELYIKIHMAYKTLISKTDREKYIKSLEETDRDILLDSRSKTGRQQALSEKEEHLRHFESGLFQLRNGRYEEALKDFNKAESLMPDKVKYRAFRAWASCIAHPEKSFDALTELKKLFKDNSDDPLLPYLLGNYYLRHKKNSEAEAFFKKALEIDPRHIDAARQLRLLHMRKSKNSEMSGLFDLFGKKR